MILISVCSRSNNRGSCLPQLVSYGVPGEIKTRIQWDAPSIYEGHKRNIEQSGLSDDDIVIMCHDDVDIISNHGELSKYLEICKKPGIGFIGTAGATTLGTDPIWWNSRHYNETRGFVFQGKDPAKMTPNYFGEHGQVVCLDGLFLAATVDTLNKIKLEKPPYLTSDWDFYDIHLTTKAHYSGFANYAVPIIVRHESDGQMREGWFQAKQEFIKANRMLLPMRVAKDKTNGLPK